MPDQISPFSQEYIKALEAETQSAATEIQRLRGLMAKAIKHLKKGKKGLAHGYRGFNVAVREMDILAYAAIRELEQGEE